MKNLLGNRVGQILAGVGLTVVVAAAAAILLRGDGDESPPALTLVAASARSDAPFTAPAAGRAPRVDRSDVVDNGRAFPGREPGVFAGVAGAPVCVRTTLIELLERDRRAWSATADAFGVTESALADRLGRFTPAVLHRDIRLTDHRLIEGAAEPYAAVLEAGTAVLLDGAGLPAIRCMSGSPLGPAEQGPVEPLAGREWAGFDLAKVSTIVPSGSVPVFELRDATETTAGFLRPAGTTGDQDISIVRRSDGVVAVPDLAGITADRARLYLEAIDLEVEVVAEPSDEVPEGSVVRLDPGAGTGVEPGSVITMVVADGPTPAQVVVVPDLTESNLSDAVTAVTALGLEPVPVVEESTQVASGVIIRTDPAAGEEVTVGSLVEIVVANLIDVAVPDVVGQTRAEAQAALRSIGLNVTVSEQQHPVVPSGRVISSEPAAGSVVPATTSVRIQVSVGPPPPRAVVPSVVGLSSQQAEAVLRDLGFKVTQASQFHDQIGAGMVISTVPGATTRAIVGSTVQLLVSQGPPPPEAIVPELAGKTFVEAQALLIDMGLNATRTDQPNAEVPAGQVLATVPGAGTRVEPGAAIEVVVSSGPAPPPSDPSPSTATTTTAVGQ